MIKVSVAGLLLLLANCPDAVCGQNPANGPQPTHGGVSKPCSEDAAAKRRDPERHQGVDFGPYIQQVMEAIKRRWLPTASGKLPKTRLHRHFSGEPVLRPDGAAGKQKATCEDRLVRSSMTTCALFPISGLGALGISHTECVHCVALCPILEPTHSLSLTVVECPEVCFRDLLVGIGDLGSAPMSIT